MLGIFEDLVDREAVTEELPHLFAGVQSGAATGPGCAGRSSGGDNHPALQPAHQLAPQGRPDPDGMGGCEKPTNKGTGRGRGGQAGRRADGHQEEDLHILGHVVAHLPHPPLPWADDRRTTGGRRSDDPGFCQVLETKPFRTLRTGRTAICPYILYLSHAISDFPPERNGTTSPDLPAIAAARCPEIRSAAALTGSSLRCV